MRNALLECRGEVLASLPALTSPSIRLPARSERLAAAEVPDFDRGSLEEHLAAFQERCVRALLQRANGNKSEAARLAREPVSTFASRLKRLTIEN